MKLGDRIAGELIIQMRTNLGMTIARAADAATMSEQQWRRLEKTANNKIELATMIRVLKALNCELHILPTDDHAAES